MRLDMPDGSGWFDLMEVSALNADHQDDYWDVQSDVRDKKRASLPPPGPDPDNPAVMAPEPDLKLTRKDIRPIQDHVLGLVVQGTSYEGVLPWDAASRARLPLPAWNLLRASLEPYYEALNGSVPDPKTGPGTSGTTSAAGAGAPRTEPEPETSATQPA